MSAQVPPKTRFAIVGFAIACVGVVLMVLDHIKEWSEPRQQVFIISPGDPVQQQLDDSQGCCKEHGRLVLQPD